MTEIHPSMQGVSGDTDVQRMQIVQPMSKTGNAGTFLCSTGMEYDSIRVAILATRDSRTSWDAGNFKFPACKSNDMVAPSKAFFDAMAEQGEILTPISESCADCPDAEWGKNDSGKQVPPKCRETHCYTMIDVATGMPFYIDFKGVSIKASRSIRAALRYRGAIWCLTMTMALAPAGQNFRVTFSDHAPTTPDDAARYEDLAGMLDKDASSDDVDDAADVEDIPF